MHAAKQEIAYVVVASTAGLLFVARGTAQDTGASESNWSSETADIDSEKASECGDRTAGWLERQQWLAEWTRV